MEKIVKILIVADESEPSVNAVKYGYRLAAQLGAEVALLAVDNTEENPTDTIIRPDISLAKERIEDFGVFLKGMEHGYAHNVKTHILIKEGNIKETVISVAEQWHADIIVAGTHARKGISRMFLGSISESILHESKIPIFIVPTGKTS